MKGKNPAISKAQALRLAKTRKAAALKAWDTRRRKARAAKRHKRQRKAA